MRKLTGLFTMVAAMTLAGCATMMVSSHVERGVNFAGFVTYEWGPPDNLPVGDPRLDNNPFFNDYLQGAIEKKLAARGYERADKGNGDLLVHYHATVNQRLDVYSVDARYGYCYGNCEPQISDYEQGTLVIDLVDAKTKKVVWRGWSQDTMNGVIDNQERLEKQVEEGVTKMMTLLPRGGAALR
ncbi:MAG TPA: DUF4136 domain-containing protein [Vicinamibacterales bacterium]|nr:DUF4136 domain-containing protein [Vicinamibacterales bacterium]